MGGAKIWSKEDRDMLADIGVVCMMRTIFPDALLNSKVITQKEDIF